MLSREQYYLDILFTEYKNHNLVLNRSTVAGSTQGIKHDLSFGLSRIGRLNPIFGKPKSIEFIAMQNKDKSGINNPQYGVIKSPETVAKLTKLVYVYNALNMSFIGSYSTVQCKKIFNIGYDTLYKYLTTGKPYKGLIFTRTKL
jgi:hypothetical protein